MHYNLVKASNRRYLEELNNRTHEMPTVYEAVNTIQETAWVINKKIFNVIKTCLQNNWTLGQLPVNFTTMEENLPPKPFDISTNKEALSKWKSEARKIHESIHKSKSKYIQVVRIVEEAELFLSVPEFYYPYQLDFRSRIYPKPAMLSPQGADYSRACLLFKYGKPMGSEENYWAYAVNGANLFGEVDKEEVAVRVKWVEDNTDRIIATATNPFEDTWWTKADKPYCFLAWAFEFAEFNSWEDDEGFTCSPKFITTIPIQSDCSNSGLQHYSAMMRDEQGGHATNLTPSDKPQDIYNLVAEKVKEQLSTMTNPLAKQWLAYGINRKICKKPVMCLPYSLTRFSCRKYIEEHLKKEFSDRNVSYEIFRISEIDDGVFKATNFLTPIVWDSITKAIPKATEIMSYIKQIAKLVASENLPVCWTTPLNFPVQMMSYETESKRVKTKMGDSIVKLSIQSYTDKISKRLTAQAVVPNYIHSLDSSVLELATVKAKKLGVDNFSMIHDSFGVVAPDVAIMAVALREAFCEIYEEDVLKKFADEMYAMLSPKNQAKFPKMPAKGTLDIQAVKQSVFFCI